MSTSDKHMADTAVLTPLQDYGILAGIAGFVLSLVNAMQTWMKNRPILSLHPGAHPADDDLEITIENPSSRSITIVDTWCWPGAHEFVPEGRDLGGELRAAADGVVNWVIAPRAIARFTLFQAAEKKGGTSLLLLVFWHSNAAFLFARIPLFALISERKREPLHTAGHAR